MEDRDIIELYWNRSEDAITETSSKYGSYCHTIAWNILHSLEDSEECVNDTYLKTWNTIPPQRPGFFKAFLGTITRNLSLDLLQRSTAQKRGGGQLPAVLDELEECVGGRGSEEQTIERLVLSQLLNRFLSELNEESRCIFLRRYWYFSEVREIARDLRISESKVKMSLLRSRKKLQRLLQEGGMI